MPNSQQLVLSFLGVRNSELFSNHWLEHRLVLEPEWANVQDAADVALDQLVALWKVQRTRVEHYGTEQALEEAFIQPVLRALGWELNYQTFLRGRKPDYALFLDNEAYDAALHAGPKNAEYWDYPALVADAKAWDRPLDRPSVVNTQREYPPEQIEWYLNNSLRDYAILTNGRLWRLIPRQHDAGQRRFQTYFECDLARLLDDRLHLLEEQAKQPGQLFDIWHGREDFLRFYLFLSPTAFRQGADGRPSLIRRAREGSNEYRLGVGEGLKQRVFDALSLCIEGFLSHPQNDLSHEHDVEVCRQESFVLLYRLLFILFAEDRKLLPYRVNRVYTDNRSLGRFRDEIAAKLDRVGQGRDNDYPPAQCDLWPDLTNLFDLIDRGAGRYGVPAYNGGLFDAESHPFLTEKALPDRHLARVIDQLGRAPDLRHPDLGLFRVDYRDLAIQHLGNVYEGLLELRPHYATEHMVVIRNRSSDRKEEKVVPEGADLDRGWEPTDRRYRQGQIYLLTDKGERRASGSYYTPNHIVDYIIEKTLGPMCSEIDAALTSEIAAAEERHRTARGEDRLAAQTTLDRLMADFDDRVLRLHIVDPSMGSGHFLIRACQFLAEQIATNPHAADPAAQELQGDEPTLTFWKRRVVERCLFGVDRNPLAVELAKLALWLETVAVDQPLTFLDHHLRHGDSLVGANLVSLGGLPGTPPLLANLFEQQVKARMPALLEAMAMIGRMPSDTIQQVKEKDRLFRRTFEPVRTPLRQAAHVWTSCFFLPPDQQVTADQYKTVLDHLDRPVKLDALLKTEPYGTAVMRCSSDDLPAFHWELEFPEVFFGKGGQREDGGFSAVIGNPPYDVLSDKETGRDLSAFKDFYESMDVYQPSFVGKNNLYKLFICRAVQLLGDRGRLGFITPMAVLGDEGAYQIRREVFRLGSFDAIEAFPQKDDSQRRVFREAKLSTAVFVLRKAAADRNRPFVSRVHPADTIAEDSPRLTLTSADVPLYDPTNLTIISCDQKDWDIAKRVTGSGRMGRLGDYAECSQGEVNETVARGKGHLTVSDQDGVKVLRGASICLYVTRPASQGTDIFVNVEAFLKGKAPDTKAFHHRHPRVGLQESSPQNNFRRIIASYIPAGEFCNHKVNYFSEVRSKLPLRFVLALLDCKLSDWYFRLGSTNAAVSHYQLHNLPCPAFADASRDASPVVREKAMLALKATRLAEVAATLTPLLDRYPFVPLVRDVISETAEIIMKIETSRGTISRSDRSALSETAQPYQNLIDTLFYRMAGLSDAETAGLESRLAQML